MTELTLHSTPRDRDVVREQIRIVGLGIRREALVAAIVLGIVTLVILIDIGRSNAASWFDSDDWTPIAFFSFLFPFAVWRREKRFGPAFLWTLPVDRRRLAFAKVLAGWVWLMIALAFVVIWQLTLAALASVPGAETVSFFAFTGTTAMYLLGSALVLGLRHPLRWFLGTFGVFFLLGTLNEALGRTATAEARMFAWSSALHWLIYGPYGIDTLLSSSAFNSAVGDATAAWQALPGLVQWATPALLWLGAGLAALSAAVRRHGERRRH